MSNENLFIYMLSPFLCMYCIKQTKIILIILLSIVVLVPYAMPVVSYSNSIFLFCGIYTLIYFSFSLRECSMLSVVFFCYIHGKMRYWAAAIDPPPPIQLLYTYTYMTTPLFTLIYSNPVINNIVNSAIFALDLVSFIWNWKILLRLQYCPLVCFEYSFIASVSNTVAGRGTQSNKTCCF